MANKDRESNFLNEPRLYKELDISFGMLEL